VDWASRLPFITVYGAPDGGRARCAVAAILSPECEVLLVRRARRPGDPWSGHWALPGGFWKEIDEDLLATALREVWEEVGIDAGNLRLLGWLEPQSPRSRPEIQVYPAVFLAEGRPEVRLSRELEDHRWAPLRGLKRGSRRIEDGLVVEAYEWRGVVIWGLTFRILRELRGE